MCPACIATVAWIAAGAGSAGGLAAFAFGRRRSREQSHESRRDRPASGSATVTFQSIQNREATFMKPDDQ